MSAASLLGADPPGDGAPDAPAPAGIEVPCANHPNRLTAVRCSACGKPICPDCMVFSPVGVKCREDARLPRSALVTLHADRWVWAIAAALGSGTAIGFGYYFILRGLGFFFFIFFVAAGIGYLVGEAVQRASGHYHGVETAGIAAAGTIWAFVFPPLMGAILSFGVDWRAIVFTLSGRGVMNWLVMALAAFFAWQRNR
jgi:hypothetical protein